LLVTVQIELPEGKTEELEALARRLRQRREKS
jgi:hypothetical protein